MSSKVFLPARGVLAWLGTPSMPQYWARVWREKGLGFRRRAPRWRRLVSLFGSFLDRLGDGWVVEAGCGDGSKLGEMLAHGRKAVGLDYDLETLRALRRADPDVPLVCADVRALPFKDGSLDGYASFGVIEHFQGGYGSILDEAARVLKSGGAAFFTFPCMSPLRRIKARFGMYHSAKEPLGENFYQYALRPSVVALDLAGTGLRPEIRRYVAAVDGLKREVVGFAWLYDKLPGPAGKAIFMFCDTALTGLCGHSFEIVAVKGPR